MRQDFGRRFELGYLGEVVANGISNKAIAGLFEKADVKNIANPNLSEPHVCFDLHGEIFYVFPKCSEIKVYKKLPLVKDDKTFKWEKRNTYGGRERVTYFTSIQLGYIQVKITYFLDGDETGIQFYEKLGAGTHRHLRAVWIEHGNNEDIKNAINEYIEMFKAETAKINLI